MQSVASGTRAGRRILVVGGVAAGASAATKARRTDEDAEVVVFERGPYVSFANCGLPYYVGGEIPKLSDLLLVTPEMFARRYRIDVKVNHEVANIDRQSKRIEVIDGTTGDRRWEAYDRLVLAPGTRPIRPPIPGIDQAGVFTLTTVPEAKGLKDWIQANGVRQAVVVGAGFIGLEAVEALLALGLEVHLVEKLPQLLPYMDVEMVRPLASHLTSKGARLHLGAEVTRFTGSGTLTGVELADGQTISAQVAVVAIGVRPELGLVRDCGLDIGQAGGVVVDAAMRTSDPDIFAAGDIAEVRNRLTGTNVRIALAGPANKEGRVAGANAAGGRMTFPGIVGTSVVKVCDMTAAKTGLGHAEARAAGFDAFVSYTHPTDHAGYYPGGKRMTIKLVADRKTGRVLGAQIVGGNGVDKRIDVLATALYAGLTVEDLEGLDLAYAPPYSSAKDPVIMAGLVASNDWRGEVATASPIELGRRVEAGECLRFVDVRTPQEYAAGHVPGAKLVQLDELRDSLEQLANEGTIYVYCGVGYRSYHACKILSHHGYDAANVSGGFTSWVLANPALIER